MDKSDINDRNTINDCKSSFDGRCSLFDADVELPYNAEGDIKVTFADKTLLFSRRSVPEGFHAESVASDSTISRAKVITFLGKYNNVAVLSDDPSRLFDSFARQFKIVTAAGGVVENSDGEVIMISRNGRWDLPKGHREAGESLSECAAREAGEETGVRVLQVAELLCTTLHSYNVYGVWELKSTAWFRMTAEATEPLIPQREEGIVVAEWMPLSVAAERIKESFPTIKTVFGALVECKGAARKK